MVEKMAELKDGKELGFMGKRLTYIRHERNAGVSSKSGKPYDFCNITLSDGLESFVMDMEHHLNESPDLLDLNKGDLINLKIDVYESFNRTQFKVVGVKKVN